MSEKKEKIQVSQIFNCKSKEIKPIKFKTPNGYEIEGYISYSLNEFKGSIYTKLVDGEFNEQVIRSMPKLNYMSKQYPFTTKDVDLREKEDGTNIGFCSLLNKEKTEILDVFPRNRNIYTKQNRKFPSIGDTFLELLNNIDTTKFYNFLYDFGGSLFFELFGSENEHEIKYLDTDLDMRFLFGYDQNGFAYNKNILNDIEKKEGFKRPIKSFELEHSLGKAHLEPSLDFIEKYASYINNDLNDFLLDNNVITPNDMYDKIKYIYDEINKVSMDKDGYYVAEGCVWTGFSREDTNKTLQVKNKPSVIEEIHSFPNGIPAIMIRKSFRTFLESNPNHIFIYMNDKESIIKFINDDLKEDVLNEKVDMIETQNRVIKIVDDYYSDKIISKNVIEKVDVLVAENPELDVSDLMREFSKKHPQLAAHSSKVYSYISSMI